ncbi:helix-turn-helix domain-containing protein [Tenacibaculum tangerinum]|uniref:Helix-turn-helix domain-containing protein n=1 Tax=Tenacibaculum tangerinum TaxID=3038772 RepID=A0ABY8L5J8_9FLAO|nr:helix-turn-helix domain-containing protein [Tenacibaculum tangerinum]WGH76549.1 helix-turn-helix domain-containing protein [Tenacibaculum tangerinum]
MKRIVLIFLFIGCCVTTFSQNHTTQDSLIQKSFQELFELFYASKPDTLKAVMYAKKYFSKALKEKDTLEMLDGKYLLADILKDKHIYLNFCDSLIEVTKKRPTKNFPTAIYLNKAVFYFHRGENSKVLKELTLGKQNLKDNDSLKHLLFYHLALAYNNIGEFKKALALNKKVYSFAKQKSYFNFKHDDFSTLPINIASVYISLNEIDSALFYSHKAVELYKKMGDSLRLGYSFFTLGGIEKKIKNYLKSIQSYKKSIPYIIDDENYRLLTSIYTTIAVQYDSLRDTKNTLLYHLKADSLYNSRKKYHRNLVETYKYLYKNSKENNNLEKQLLYLNKLLEVKEFRLQEKTKIKETLTEEYDIPNLLSEKKRIIAQLENEVHNSKRNRIIYISLLLLSLVLIGYQIQRKRTFKKRFMALVNQKETTNKEETPPLQQTTNKHELADELVQTLLKGLQDFEKNTDFLDSKINLQLLADRLDTNTSYLSKVVNQYKKASFSNYINQLRVDYAVEKLKKDVLWRKYTIKAIAEEVGFKNAEAFSKAFYKFSGIKPSYFIKELEKQ